MPRAAAGKFPAAPDVGGRAEDFSAMRFQLGGRGSDLVGRPADDGEVRAVAGEGMGDAEIDSARPAGDEHDAILEVE
jgi:hypothetical protein